MSSFCFRKLIHHRKETVSRKSHSPTPQGTVMTQSSSDHHLDVSRQPNGVCRMGYERHHSLPNTEFEDEDEGLYQVTVAGHFLGSSFGGVAFLVLLNKMLVQLKLQIRCLCCWPRITAVSSVGVSKKSGAVPLPFTLVMLFGILRGPRFYGNMQNPLYILCDYLLATF